MSLAQWAAAWVVYLVAAFFVSFEMSSTWRNAYEVKVEWEGVAMIFFVVLGAVVTWVVAG